MSIKVIKGRVGNDFVYLGEDFVGELDFDAPGDGHPFLILEHVNLNVAQLRELADWLEQQPLPEHLRKYVK